MTNITAASPTLHCLPWFLRNKCSSMVSYAPLLTSDPKQQKCSSGSALHCSTLLLLATVVVGHESYTTRLAVASTQQCQPWLLLLCTFHYWGIHAPSSAAAAPTLHCWPRIYMYPLVVASAPSAAMASIDCP